MLSYDNSEVDCEVFEQCPYVRVEDANIHRQVINQNTHHHCPWLIMLLYVCDNEQVEGAIEVFVTSMDASEKKMVEAKDYRGTVVLQFYTTQKKSALGGLISRDEKVYWERWAIPLHVTKPKGGSGNILSYHHDIDTNNTEMII